MSKVLYIHGLGRQPSPNSLKYSWDMALFGEPRANSRVVYWAKQAYPPENETLADLLKGQPEDKQSEMGDIAYNYLTDKKKREHIQKVLIEELDKDKKFIIIAHSAGALLAYDVLSKYDTQIEVPLLLTIGSPLTHPYLYARMVKQFPGKLPKPWCVGKWRNFLDPGDHWALEIEGYFEGKGIKDIYTQAGGHKAVDYLSSQDVQEEVLLSTLPLYKFML